MGHVGQDQDLRAFTGVEIGYETGYLKVSVFFFYFYFIFSG